MADAIRQRVRIHDRYQLEIKIEYPLLPRKRTHYHLNTYIIIPHTLAINELSYPPSEFYRRLQNYIRFKTPTLSAKALLQDATSPLQIIDRLWQDPAIDLQDDAAVVPLIEQFKLLRAILRRTLERRLRKRWQRLLATKEGGDDSSTQPVVAATQLLADHVAIAQRITERFRCHGVKVDDPAISTRLHDSYRLTDEAISVVVEVNLLNALRMIDESPFADHEEEVKPVLVAAIQQELAHRQQQGYRSLLPQQKQRSRSPAMAILRTRIDRR